MDKEIEEIQNEIDYELSSCNKYNGINDCGTCELLNDKCQCTLSETLAKALYNVGYGKVENFKEQLETDEEYEKNLNNVINKQITEIARLNKEIIELKEDREKCINALSDQYTFKTTQDGVFCDVFDIVRKQAIKEFVEKLMERVMVLEEDCELIDDLLKEYGVEL